MINILNDIYTILSHTYEQNKLNNTNTTKHIYRVPVIIYI